MTERNVDRSINGSTSDEEAFVRLLDIVLNGTGILPGKIHRNPDENFAKIRPLVPLYYLSGDVVETFFLPSASKFLDGDYVVFKWKNPGHRGQNRKYDTVGDAHATQAESVSQEEADKLGLDINTRVFQALRDEAVREYEGLKHEYETRIAGLDDLNAERTLFNQHKDDWEGVKRAQEEALNTRENEVQNAEHLLAPYLRIIPPLDTDEISLDIPSPMPLGNLYVEWPKRLRDLNYHFDDGSTAENAVNSFLLSTAAALYTGSLVLLNGPVGAGKTSIIEKAAEILSGTIKASAIVPVRPAWIDSTDLLGFFDPISNVYRPTPFVDALLRADRLSNEHVIFFLCLDELNLARIENYGADLLSRLEYGRNGANSAGASSENTELHLYSSDIHFALKEELDSVIETQDQDLKVRQRRLQLCRQLMKYPAKLRIPPNLLLLGSLNADETTYELSPKVIDRSYVVTYPPADLDLASTTSASLPAVVATPMSTPLATDSSHRVSISEMVGQMKRQIDLNPIPPGWEEIVKWNREFLSNGISIPLSYRSKRDFDAFSAAAHCFGLSDKDAIVGHFLFTKVLPRIRFTANNHRTQTSTSARVQLYKDFLTAIEEKYAEYDPAGILTGLREQASDPQSSIVRYFGMDRI